MPLKKEFLTPRVRFLLLHQMLRAIFFFRSRALSCITSLLRLLFLIKYYILFGNADKNQLLFVGVLWNLFLLFLSGFS